ncbi:riboflavin kinase [Methanoculleus taiwanensis]|uniref:Shikimate dehydrogenase (NADP(+)) n=1 Tax=Methanoculleus taiwanensis TaxID=1550565 RepID=A0A498H062_9EURY|nr:shikimate dehydrogenase [Methanoculleus taiwanensis]RXE55246.1 riboflavin kinase [Methanoculleus taiwanensis]
MKIVLTGYRGTGKTAVGRRLAHRLGLPFADTDALIEEKAGIAIPEIFEQRGETAFRRIEREVIASLRNFNGVVSTGGGAVTDPANVAMLRRDGTVVLLTADPAVIEERIRGSDRPGLTVLPLRDEIREVLRERRLAYLSSADVCIDTGSCSVGETVEKLAALLTAVPAMPGGFSVPGDLMAVRERDPLTRICGIAGNPCSHSRSPALYNRLFEEYGLHYYYTRFEWPTVEPIVRLARALDVRGLSVTIPFKQDIIPFLDEVDADAAAIGAVNTVVQCGGRLHGFNTDWLGVKMPLEHRRGARAVVLGAGGAAAATVYALRDLDMAVTVLNRTRERARILAERFGCAWGGFDEFEGRDTDVVVNTTPVGMEDARRSPLPADRLERGMTVFDLVYTPPETKLIREARMMGCETIPGTEMFVHQAAAQFRLITGIAVDAACVREMMQ